MDSTAKVTELHFEPPGPGSWELDPVHFPRPMTRYWTEVHPEAFRRWRRDYALLGKRPMNSETHSPSTNGLNIGAHNRVLRTRPAAKSRVPAISLFCVHLPQHKFGEDVGDARTT